MHKSLIWFVFIACMVDLWINGDGMSDARQLFEAIVVLVYLAVLAICESIEKLGGKIK